MILAAAAQPVQHAARLEAHEASGDAADADAGLVGDSRVGRVEAAAGVVEEIEQQGMQHGEPVAAEGAVLATLGSGLPLEFGGPCDRAEPRFASGRARI